MQVELALRKQCILKICAVSVSIRNISKNLSEWNPFQWALYKSSQALDSYAFVGLVSFEILFLKCWISYNTFRHLVDFFLFRNSSVSLKLFLVISDFFLKIIFVLQALVCW